MIQYWLPLILLITSTFSVVEVAPYWQGSQTAEVADLQAVGAKIVRTWAIYDPAGPSVDPQMVQKVTELRRLGIHVLLTIKGTECNVPDSDWPRFLSWVKEVVKAASADYVEFWNEPDTYGCLPSVFGGWASYSDDYFGGAKYGFRLTEFYDAVKSVNPHVKVAFGGLMLGCMDCVESTFFQGAVLAGAKFDLVSFHYYPVYPANISAEIAQVDRRYKYLRQYTDKPIWLSETSLLSDTVSGSAFQERQAEWLSALSDYSKDHQMTYIWYGLYIDWRYSALVQNGKPTRAFMEMSNQNTIPPDRYPAPEQASAKAQDKRVITAVIIGLALACIVLALLLWRKDEQSKDKL